jgi:DNA polymerase-3 subunit delta
MIHVLHGEDEFTRSEELARLRAGLGDSTTSSLNTTILEGRTLNYADLVGACEALPFMASTRLVIVEDFWARFEPPEGVKGRGRGSRVSESDQKLIESVQKYLPTLPETTDLVFSEGRRLKQSNPVFPALSGGEGKAELKEFAVPKAYELVRWIEQRTKTKGGAIAPPAAQELARLVGGELRQLDHELDKLLASVNYSRIVGVNDVHGIVSATQVDSIFALVDAIGMRQRQKAMRALHSLLDSGAAPQYLLSMIERQFRILLQIKEMHARGVSTAEMQRILGVWHSWVMDKNLGQARNFSQAELLSIFSRLADVEQETKTGVIDERLALDVLVTELAS